MAEEHPDTLNEVKRLHGTMLAEAWRDFMERVEGEPESITLVEWSEAIVKFCSRPEVIESFQTVLNWFAAAPIYEKDFPVPRDVPAPRGVIHVEIANKPGLSTAFVEAVKTYCAQELKRTLVVELRDPILASAFMVEGQRLKRTVNKVRLPESMGLR